MLLITSLPNLSQELTALLIFAGEPILASQVTGLEIVQRCPCEDDFCATFYTAPRPNGAYGPGHRNVSLEPEKGMIVLDVLDERIMKVEILYRDEVRSQLASIFS
jgi:hypothetical protein